MAGTDLTWLLPDHSAAELLPIKGMLPFLDQYLPSGVAPGQAVEFTGPSGSAKTQCLIEVVTRCIMPRTWGAHAVGGLESGCVVLDTLHRFPVRRLAAILRLRYRLALSLGSSGSVASAPDEEAFIAACLLRAFIFRCGNTLQLLCTVKSVPDLLASQRCKIVVLDSANAFFIPDRMEPATSLKLRNATWAALKDVIRRHRLVLFAASAAFFATGDPAGRDELWRTAVVNHAFFLERATAVADGCQTFTAFPSGIAPPENTHIGSQSFGVRNEGICAV
jgi:hypothetical protein